MYSIVTVSNGSSMRRLDIVSSCRKSGVLMGVNGARYW